MSKVRLSWESTETGLNLVLQESYERSESKHLSSIRHEDIGKFNAHQKFWHEVEIVLIRLKNIPENTKSDIRTKIAAKIKPIPPSLYLALTDRAVAFDRQIEDMRQKIATEQKQLEELEKSRRETIVAMIQNAGFKY
jgi:hypothetical protein